MRGPALNWVSGSSHKFRSTHVVDISIGLFVLVSISRLMQDLDCEFS